MTVLSNIITPSNVLTTTNTATVSNKTLTSPVLTTPTLGVATATSLQGIIGNVTPAAGAFTTVDASSTVTLSGGTANGVTYLNGSKVLTSGSALQFTGSNLSVGIAASANEFGNNVQINQTILNDDNAGTNHLTKNAFYNSGWKYISTDFASKYTQSLGTHQWSTAPSGTAGNAVTFTEGMRLTSTGLGIGTSSPKEKLDSRGAAVFSGDNATGTNAFGTAEGVLLSTSSGVARITAVSNGANNVNLVLRSLNAGSASSTLMLDYAGNLGLGVTPSAWSGVGAVLQINTGGTFLSASGSNSTMILGTNAHYNGSSYVFKTSSSPAALYQQNGGTHAWSYSGAATAGNTFTFTQAMTLDASGNLGIGTTTPSSFDGSADNLVVGTTTGNNGITIAAGTSSASTLNFADGTAGGAQYTGYIDYQHSGDYMRFGTNGGNERMRIDSSGNLLVGTTSGTRHILKKNATGDDAAQIENSASATPYGLFIYFSGAAPNDATRYFIAGQDTSAARFQLRSNGGLGNYSANNVNLSDRREKTNFAPATSYLDKICAIPVQTFNYIDQNLEEDGGLTLGVVAQDVQAVAPELVMESNWASKDETPKMRLSIYQTDLQYALMKCIQEQQALIQSLKARLDAANL